MSAFTLAPTGAGAYTQLLLGAGSSNWSAVTTNDGDTTWIKTNGDSTQRQDTYVMADLPANAISITGSVTCNYVMRTAGTPDGSEKWRSLFRSGTTDYVYGSNMTVINASYNLYSQAWADLSGTPWTVALLNGIQAGSRAQAATAVSRQTQFYLSGDYVASGLFVVTHALPLIGTLPLAGMAGLMRLLEPHVRYTRDELESMWNDILRSRRGYVFAGA
jgi:hypothetical protein